MRRIKTSVRVRSQNCENQLLASSCLPVRQHGTTHLTLDGFPRNFIYEDFSKISRKIDV
jgi:hypothetical protein